MFEELLSGYMSPYLCLQNLFESQVLHNFWTCCIFWTAWDMTISFAENHCGHEGVASLNSSFELAFPGIRSECPGYNSMTCAQWFLIPLVLIIIGATVTFLFICWTVIITIKYYRMRYRQVGYCFSSTNSAEHNHREKKGILNINAGLS